MQHKNSIMKIPLPLFGLLACSISMLAQTKDTTVSKSVDLKGVSVSANLPGTVERMPEVKYGAIYSGKKNEVIQMESIKADLSTNNTRQVFAKVPGVHVWENDGSGIQVGIATRGLNPNRSWEFNVRQNGYDVSSEIFGYPEAYYTPPMEAVQNIEVIRGASSLQYGPQFGGMLNFQLKKADPNKPVSFETRQTVGSYGLFNTFNALGLTKGKLSVYGYLQHRSSAGWRENSRYDVNASYLSIAYQLTKKISIEADYSNMGYRSQQPGGLTDAQFEQNARQSARSRNWFSTPWNVASLTVKYDVNENFKIQLKSFGTVAQRNSVGFVRAITIADTINAATLQFNNRQIDRDYYENYGSELRTTYDYKLGKNKHTLAAGARVYSGFTIRRQSGVGTTGNDFDLTLLNPQYGRDLQFRTMNYSVFAENIFRITSKLKVIPGVRYEYIDNSIAGYINTTATGKLNPETRNRQVLLYGLGTEYQVTEKTQVYGNYSLGYRPVTFAELTPSATTDVIDQNMKDQTGFNADLGYRGNVGKALTFDVGVFYLFYDNRIGNLTRDGNVFRTNIGASVSQGVESYIEWNAFKTLKINDFAGDLNLFSSNSLIDARYTRWDNPAIEGNPVTQIKDKRVENAPTYIHRVGATYSYKGFSASWQLSSVSDVFTDAANTEKANAAATVGKLEGYTVMDANIAYKFQKNYMIQAGVNNLTDEVYATRRAGGYPGPGIMPGNGRTFYFTIGAKF